MYLNGGHTPVGARPLAGGGLVVLLDDKSHSVYWREEVGALRLMVDSKTCLIEQENDPTQLRSPSPGKLVHFLVFIFTMLIPVSSPRLSSNPF